MNIVSMENVSKNFGFKPLFENVTLGLEDRDKIGIIGANGSGKTNFISAFKLKSVCKIHELVMKHSYLRSKIRLERFHFFFSQ